MPVIKCFAAKGINTEKKGERKHEIEFVLCGTIPVASYGNKYPENLLNKKITPQKSTLALIGASRLS